MSTGLSRADVLAGIRLLARLPAFLRAPADLAQARDALRRRHEERAESFLALVRATIAGRPASPYHRLLAHAGCEHGDLVRLVAQEGVEGALRVLYHAGVYLTVEEFKGRRPVVRGSTAFTIDPVALHNPTQPSSLTTQTSGSRGPRHPVAIGLAFIEEGATNRLLTLAARGGERWSIAYWDVPGGALGAILAYARAGSPPVRWFSPVDPHAPDLHPRYRWSVHVLRWAGWLAGVPLPRPEHVPVDQPLSIARWLVEVLRTGGTPFLLTYSSPAVRLCRAALAAGLRLDGAHLALYGEPITAARLALIRQAGAEATAMYITTESGRTGDACLAPGAADEVHFFDDLHALIQPGAHPREGLPPRALLLSSLRRSAPMILLNVSMGDQATVLQRACGCPLERLGWTTHLHTIRSYEKLTAGGMTFLDHDVIRVLEEVLPARFGGAPTHYQLVEGRADDGQPRVRLLVDPAVGPVDAEAVVDTFLRAIASGSSTGPIMATVWRDAALLRVERRPPLATGSGKILHLHLEPSGPGP